MTNRFRRLRSSQSMRDLIRETQLSANDLIQPFFVIDGKNKKEAISSMPGIYRFTIDLLLKEVEQFIRLGGKGAILFGISHQKDTTGKHSHGDKAIIPQAVKALKKNFPNFLIMTDICLCAYMSHGHCGVIKDGRIDNDLSLPVLAKMALSHAHAGADMVAPSDMMDFRVKAIREALDKDHLTDVGILSYAAKYASTYYGPFREAAGSAPEFGDRRTYQMDPANSREALKEARQNIIEGADMVMVKPALAYLDIVALLRKELNVPIVAYNVSGEYSLIKAAAQKGWVNETAIILETLLSMKRAGADIIITYHAKDIIKDIQ